jgi:hypothetical protein
MGWAASTIQTGGLDPAGELRGLGVIRVAVAVRQIRGFVSVTMAVIPASANAAATRHADHAGDITKWSRQDHVDAGDGRHGFSLPSSSQC